MIAGKLVTKGDAEIMMLYSCVTTDGEETAETMRFTLPFSQIIDIDGIDDTFTADVRITPAGCDIIPKSDDSGTLECELVLLVNCVAKSFPPVRSSQTHIPPALSAKLKGAKASLTAKA